MPDGQDVRKKRGNKMGEIQIAGKLLLVSLRKVFKM